MGRRRQARTYARPHALFTRLSDKASEWGTAALEFALVVPLFITLIFGVTSVGLVYSDHLAITNAVREGARLGSAIDFSAGGWATSVRDRVIQTYANSGNTLTSSQVCVQLVNASNAVVSANQVLGSACQAAPPSGGVPAGTPPNACVVKVWAYKPERIQLIVFPDLSPTIGAQSVSLYERAVSPCSLT